MSVPNIFIEGYDPTKYQKLKVQADGTLKASEPFFGKIYQFLGMKTHIDKKIIEEFKALVDKKNNDFDKGKLDSKLTYGQLNLITKNISETINYIKEEHLKVDEGIDLDDFSSRLAQRREVGLLYRKINEGMKEAYELATAKDTIRSGHPYLHFKADYLNIGEYKEKLENLAYKIRVLHLYNIYDGDIPPNLAKPKDRSLSKEQMLAEIDKGIEGLISPLQRGVVEENYKHRTIGFGDEFRVRLEIFRDTGIFPQCELTQEQFPREEIPNSGGLYKLAPKPKVDQSKANLLNFLNRLPLKSDTSSGNVARKAGELADLISKRAEKRKMLNRGEAYDSTPSGLKLNAKIQDIKYEIMEYFPEKYKDVIADELATYDTTGQYEITSEDLNKLRSLGFQRDISLGENIHAQYQSNLKQLRDLLAPLAAEDDKTLGKLEDLFLFDLLNLATMNSLELDELNEGINREGTEKRINAFIDEMVNKFDQKGILKLREKLAHFVQTGELDTKRLKENLSSLDQQMELAGVDPTPYLEEAESLKTLLSFLGAKNREDIQNFVDHIILLKLMNRLEGNQIIYTIGNEIINIKREDLDKKIDDSIQNMSRNLDPTGTAALKAKLIQFVNTGTIPKGFKDVIIKQLADSKAELHTMFEGIARASNLTVMKDAFVGKADRLSDLITLTHLNDEDHQDEIETLIQEIYRDIEDDFKKDLVEVLREYAKTGIYTETNLDRLMCELDADQYFAIAQKFEKDIKGLGADTIEDILSDSTYELFGKIMNYHVLLNHGLDKLEGITKDDLLQQINQTIDTTVQQYDRTESTKLREKLENWRDNRVYEERKRVV